MINKIIQGNEQDNSKIVCFPLAEEIKKHRLPSAEDLVEEVPLRRIIIK